MLPASVRIFVCTVPQDMRRSFDALAQATAQLLGEDPRSGALFVFINKRSTRAKVLWWDANGYCLLYKRLHQAIFIVPSTSAGGSPVVRIDAVALASLLAQLRWTERDGAGVCFGAPRAREMWALTKYLGEPYDAAGREAPTPRNT
jgi:transposase